MKRISHLAVMPLMLTVGILLLSLGLTVMLTPLAGFVDATVSVMAVLAPPGRLDRHGRQSRC
jgi:hypothetical protein